jgi:hypothetical protein
MKNLKIILAVLAGVIIAISLILFSSLVDNYQEIVENPLASVSPPAGQFADCKLLANNCSGDVCQYYSLCQSASPEWKNCKVYDCDSSYGIEITSKKDDFISKTYNKVNVEEAKENISACQGTIQVVGNKCEKNNSKIEIKAETSGNCDAEAFVYEQYGEWKPALFESLQDSSYILTIPSCDQIVAIKVIGKSGILIGSFEINKK